MRLHSQDVGEVIDSNPFDSERKVQKSCEACKVGLALELICRKWFNNNRVVFCLRQGVSYNNHLSLTVAQNSKWFIFIWKHVLGVPMHSEGKINVFHTKQNLSHF